jgi:uncharacterized membrane protein YgcG
LGAVSLLLGVPAWANDPIVLVGGPPIVADGTTKAKVQIWSPALAAEATVSVKGAIVIGEPVLDGGDFASFEIQPAAVVEAGQLELKVKVSSSEGKGVATLRVPVVPADLGDVGMTFDPPVFRHGVDNAVSIRITPPAGPRAMGSQTLEVHSNIGVIDTVTLEEGGRTFVARWRPPKDLAGSQMALFAVVDAASPDRVMGTAPYPVIKKKALELPAAAGTSAVLSVGDRQFGPLPAGPNGRVSFDVERDPRVSVGRLRIIAADGGVTESDVELAFGEGPRFTFVPTPVGAVADPDQKLKVTVVAINPDGTPWTRKAPEVKVDRGTVSGVVAATESGRFVVTFTPPSDPGEVTFTAVLDGQSASRSIQLVPPVDLAARSGGLDPVLLEGTAKDATFTIEGAAPGQVVVRDGSLRGAPKGSGPVQQAVRLSGEASQMVVRAGPSVTASGRPVTRVFLWTTESRLQADAVTQVPVLAVAVDDQGVPVPGVELALTVAAGSGTVTDVVTTGPDGLAAGLYTAGNRVGPITLAASGSGVTAASPMFLEGAGYTGDELSVSGDPSTLAQRESWISAVAVARAGRPFPAAQPAVAPMTGADLARIEAEKKAKAKADKKQARLAAAQPKPAADKPGGGGGKSGGGGNSGGGGKSGGGDALTSFGPAPADGMGRSNARYSAHLGAMPRSYDAVGEGDGSLPGGASSFTTPGLAAPGIDLRGIKWFNTIGAEARFRYVSQPVAVPPDDEVQLGGVDIILNARLRGAIQPGLSWQLAGGFHGQSVSGFVLGDASVVEAQQGLSGVRLAGGVTLDRGRVYIAPELAGTFSLAPSTFQLGTTVGYEVTDGIAVQLLYDYTVRSATVTEDDASILVAESLNGIFVGAAFVMP